MASRCHILRPDLSWLTECGRESNSFAADKSDIGKRWCEKCKRAHKTRPVSELNPACPCCSSPLARVKDGDRSRVKCATCCYASSKRELTPVIPRGSYGGRERPGRVRSRHARDRAKNYVLHIQTRLTTVCNQPLEYLDCYPLYASREDCILEDQCCRSCAKVVRKSIADAMRKPVDRRAETIRRKVAHAISVRRRVIDAVFRTQALQEYEPVRTDEVMPHLGECVTSRRKMMWSRVFVRVAASGSDETGRRLLFAGRVARGYMWKVALPINLVAVTGSEPVESKDI